MATKSRTPFFTFQEFLQWAKEQARKEQKYRRLFKPKRFVGKRRKSNVAAPVPPPSPSDLTAGDNGDLDDWLDSGRTAEEFWLDE